MILPGVGPLSCKWCINTLLWFIFINIYHAVSRWASCNQLALDKPLNRLACMACSSYIGFGYEYGHLECTNTGNIGAEGTEVGH